MEVNNITGLEKPLQKLVETVSEGVGVLGNHFFEFDVAKIERTGEAKAEAERKKIIAQAEAQEEAVAILGRAEKRFALEQYNKQINLENILVKTRDQLEGEEVSDEEVERDWSAQFLNTAQDVSREKLQDILAQILSGEIKQPGQFSYQTLEVIKVLSKKDLELFKKFLAISTDTGVIKTKRGDFLSSYNLTFENYLRLSSIGLFSQSTNLRYKQQIAPQQSLLLEVGQDKFLVSHNEDEIKEFSFQAFAFSEAGKELRSLLVDQAQNGKSEKYQDDLISVIEDKGFSISKNN